MRQQRRSGGRPCACRMVVGGKSRSFTPMASSHGDRFSAAVSSCWWHFTYRLFSRLRWRLHRDRGWEVRIYRVPEIDAHGNSSGEQSALLLFRSPQPTKADALEEAIRVVEEVRSGRTKWGGAASERDNMLG